MKQLGQNLRRGMRLLYHSPGFAAICILTIALGVGANTAVFSVMNAVLLRQLPVSNPQTLVYFRVTGVPSGAMGAGDPDTSFSYPVYTAIREETDALSQVIAYAPLAIGRIAVRVGSSPGVADGDLVSGNFFSGLGVPILRGRGFTQTDEAQHTAKVVLSYAYWTRQFSREPDVIGKSLYINGLPFTIVGITAEGFEGTEPGTSVDFWIPLQNRTELNPWGFSPVKNKTYLELPNYWCLRLIGRLRPGIGSVQALDQVQPVFRRAAYIGIGTPAFNAKPPILSFHNTRGFGGYDRSYNTPLEVLMAMVALVLFIALSNVVMLLLARNTVRRQEFSVRLALGARRKDLLNQLLAESLVLVSIGGVLAVVFAFWATRYLASWAAVAGGLHPDRTVLIFALAVLVMTACILGVAPLRLALDSSTSLISRSSSAAGRTDTKRSQGRRVILTLQIALCTMLLVGAGLLIRTLQNLKDTPLGLRAHGLVVFDINPQSHSLEESIPFYQHLLDRLRVLPGVNAVSIMEHRLGSGWSNNFPVMIDGQRLLDSSGRNIVRSNVIGPDFFHTLGVQVLAGREFTEDDVESSPRVVIVNETFAKRFFHGEDALGHHIGSSYLPGQAAIIGIIADHKYTSIDEKPMPMAWFPYTQTSTLGQMSVELRVEGEFGNVLSEVRQTILLINPNLSILNPMTQREQFNQSILQQELFARLSSFFGMLAVLLVATGLYGSLAYSVSNRVAEIGIRMAVGAGRWQVVWMIMRSSLILLACGVAVGVPLAALVSHALASALYGVAPYDVLIYLFAVVLVTVVTLLASVIPARSAARIDPIRALRAE